jgi:hypothetical protein
MKDRDSKLAKDLNYYTTTNRLLLTGGATGGAAGAARGPVGSQDVLTDWGGGWGAGVRKGGHVLPGRALSPALPGAGLARVPPPPSPPGPLPHSSP